MKKSILVLSMVFLSLSQQSFAQEEQVKATTMWETEYRNKVDNALYALNSKNYDVAFERLTEAAQFGDKQSQFYLAQMYLNGWGMEKPDYKMGWIWLNLALEQKTSEWREAYVKIKRALPDEFVTAMEPHVAEYMGKYGAEAQDMRCVKRAKVGSNIKDIICEKRFVP